MIRAALADAAARLAPVSDTPRLDAELLMAHALGVTREAMLLDPADRPVPAGFAALLARRLAHEPVAYLVGRRDFWTIDLAVAPGVLIPRPDSETLIEAAVGHFRGTAGPRTVLDLGTGSGALLLAALAEWPCATGTGIDRSSTAVAIAAANAARLGLSGRVRIVEGGWEDAAGRHDLILCNPPYVRTGTALPAEVIGHEPPGALFAGTDGLDDHRRIVPLLPRLLAAGGIACLEIGHDQAAAVRSLAAQANLQAGIRRDLGGRDRCLLVTG